VSGDAVGDVLGALALMFVFEGLGLVLASGRIAEILEQLREIPPERLRWAGLVMAAVGTGAYVLIRG